MNKEILIVEDDDFKLEKLQKTLQHAAPGYVFCAAKSVHTAIEMLDQEYQLIILDMALPSHSVMAGASPATSLPSGGIEVLLELAYAGRNDRVIVVTQYPEIEIEDVLVPTESALDVFAEHGMSNVVAVLLYKPDDPNWVIKLTEIVSRT